MNTKYHLIYILIAGSLLSACGSDYTASNANENANTLAFVGGVDEDNEPLALNVNLESNIESVFGNADSIPKEVVAGDTIQSVVNRAKSF